LKGFPMQSQKKWQPKVAAFYIALIILSSPILMSCGDEQETPDLSPSPTKPESFTFFDIGINTKLTSGIRKDLGDKLGHEATENRNIIDLEINYRGFLKKYFPEINELNRKLNYPPGERVDHNTVKLMYRYAQKENIPFDYVELIFSNYTGSPLLIRIEFKNDEANIIETLKEKYGRPQVLDWKEENGKSMFWEKYKDHLIVSLVPDQFGKPGYQILIYFVENLKELIDTEMKEREQKEQEKAKTGKTAF
jgi:hypothetical protein